MGWLWHVLTANRTCTSETDANRNFDAVGEKEIPFRMVR
jgi:hypothetical protein